MKLNQRLIITTTCLLLLAAVAQASVPRMISYQGKAADAAGNPVPDGDYQVRFYIYNHPTAGSVLWFESFFAVHTTGGLFNHMLGSISPIPDSLFAKYDSLYLAVMFNFEWQSPRVPLVSTGYAFRVNSVDGATGGTITGNVTFESSTVVIGDSTFRANNFGIRVGDNTTPSTATLATFERKYSTPANHTGLRITQSNDLAGSLIGISCRSGDSTTVDGSGERTGVDAQAFSGYYPGANSYGVKARASSRENNAYGLFAEGIAEFGGGSQYGVYATITGSGNGFAGYFDGGSYGSAGYFAGRVQITGTLTKGGGAFRIDHPLDPENKYLQHSFVESPDMKNIYDGIVILDAAGRATVTLPDWFGALNRDFRYQLTCIGSYAPVYIAEKMQNNRFTIAGGRQGMEVSWQVTGIRQDKWAESNRIQVEVDKPADERGTYLHPKEFGQPPEKSVDWEQRQQSRGNTQSVDSEQD